MWGLQLLLMNELQQLAELHINPFNILSHQTNNLDEAKKWFTLQTNLYQLLNELLWKQN